MKEFIGVGILLVLFVVIAYPIESMSCSTKGKSFEDVEYHLIGGCMVKHKGKWLPLENIRGFDDN